MIQTIKAKGNLKVHERMEGYAFLHFKDYTKNIIDTSIKPDFIFIHASYQTLIFVEVLINPTITMLKEKIEKYLPHCNQLWFYIYSEDGKKFDEVLNSHDRVRIYYYPEILEEIKRLNPTIVDDIDK
jgi:hypothetical protein